MSVLLLFAGLIAASDTDWRFVDEPTFAGRSVIAYRSIDLAEAPATPLHVDDRPLQNAKFGAMALGPDGKKRLGVVWHRASATVWLDADGDGRYAPGERHTLDSAPLTIPVTISFGAGRSAERTILIRPRGDGLAYAVRGYTTGRLNLNGKAVPALLTDGDADGCFNGAGADRVWIDLDGDGRFDPLTEQFPLGTAITAGKSVVLIQPDADGLLVNVRERPNETGALLVRFDLLPQSDVVELVAQYVSEFGEMVTVREANKAVPVPAGKYRVNSLRLKLADADGQVWRYSFSRDGEAYDVGIAQDKETTHKPLHGIKLKVTVDATVSPGGSAQVQPDVAAGPLYLTGCEVGPRHVETGRDIYAAIVLCEPGSAIIDRTASGFL